MRQQTDASHNTGDKKVWNYIRSTMSRPTRTTLKRRGISRSILSAFGMMRARRSDFPTMGSMPGRHWSSISSVLAIRPTILPAIQVPLSPRPAQAQSTISPLPMTRKIMTRFAPPLRCLDSPERAKPYPNWACGNSSSKIRMRCSSN